MNFNDYQDQSRTTAVYGDSVDKLLAPISTILNAIVHEIETDHDDISDNIDDAVASIETIRYLLNLSHSVLGLASKAGNAAHVLKMAIRHGVTEDTNSKLTKETGDCLWYTAAIAADCDAGLQDLATGNLIRVKGNA